jgi:hypothetical protein
MSDPSAARAGSAIGAMFFSVFGGVWLVMWSLQAYGVMPVLLALIAAGAIGLFLGALRQFRHNRSAHAAEANTPESKRTSRIFNIVNAIQWTMVFIAANVLNNMGYKEWFVPVLIFIVGAHFLPLAAAFKARRHYFIGAAMILLALIYPFVAPGGPSNPVGCLGAGLILWAGAFSALIPE